jgi:hypothetical protein
VGPTAENRHGPIGVQVDYNVLHLRTSLVQLFVLHFQNFEKVVQMIELKRFGGAPNGYPFAPLRVVQMIELKRFGGAPNGYPFAPLRSKSTSFSPAHHAIARFLVAPRRPRNSVINS